MDGISSVINKFSFFLHCVYSASLRLEREQNIISLWYRERKIRFRLFEGSFSEAKNTFLLQHKTRLGHL